MGVGLIRWNGFGEEDWSVLREECAVAMNISVTIGATVVSVIGIAAFILKFGVYSSSGAVLSAERSSALAAKQCEALGRAELCLVEFEDGTKCVFAYGPGDAGEGRLDTALHCKF
jgi:hypothetical protein